MWSPAVQGQQVWPVRQCVVKNSTSGGPRWVDVTPERFPGWVASFARRHAADGGDRSLTVTRNGDTVIFTAPDGAVAECHPPFPPLADNSKKRLAAGPRGPGEADDVSGASEASEAAGGEDEARLAAEAVAAHARRPRTVGVLLVRLGGYAAGVFTGYPPALSDAKTGSRLVHGRSAAGRSEERRVGKECRSRW